MQSAQYTVLNFTTDWLVSEFSCHILLGHRRLCALIVDYQLLSINVKILSHVATQCGQLAVKERTELPFIKSMYSSYITCKMRYMYVYVYNQGRRKQIYTWTAILTTPTMVTTPTH